jgi:Ca2+-binding RTX toxin-like protein
VAAACLASAAPAAADWQIAGGGPVATGGASLSSGQFRNYDMRRIGGHLYVAWTQSNGHNRQVRVARLADDGASWAPVGDAVNADPARDAQEPSLAAAPDGSPWIAWDEVDPAGAVQIRAARFDSGAGRWIEPDARDWQINDVPNNWPASDRAVFSARGPRLTFLGHRPYITYMQDNPSEWNIEVVRLASGGHSWERVARGVGSSIPLDADAAVTGGLLHVGLTSGWEYPTAVRLNQNGGWEQLGGGPANQDVLDDSGYPHSAAFSRIAGFHDEPYVLWSTSTSTNYAGETYASHVVDGKWQIAGGNIGDGTGGTSLREIGGRLFAGWVSGADSPELHVSRLSDDGTSWVGTPPIAGTPTDHGAVLSSSDGVPYVAWVRTGGTANELVVERLDGSPDAIAGDDGEGSGPGTDPDVDATPIVPPDDTPAPAGPCATKMPGTPGPDWLRAGSHGTTIRGLAGADHELGGPLRDCLYGGDGGDVLRGRDGEDGLFGGAGPDKLFGGPDEDSLTGGPGPDELSGGPGWDTFRGGPGDDTILAADGRGENVYCGPGADTARLDRYDRPHGCEHVRVARG